MMDFKEAFADDLKNAYFDTGEFASTHTIDGAECTVVMTEVRADDAKAVNNVMRTTLIPKDTSINRVTHMLYARDTELRHKITVGSMINLDGRRCFVFAVSHTDGVYTIAVGTNTV
jgi:hypothetical protein